MASKVRASGVNAAGNEDRGGVSKVKLALGAASLFLFIVGLKRTFTPDTAPGGAEVRDEPPLRDGTGAGGGERVR
jgi:hypothetical protein